MKVEFTAGLSYYTTFMAVISNELAAECIRIPLLTFTDKAVGKITICMQTLVVADLIIFCLYSQRESTVLCCCWEQERLCCTKEMYAICSAKCQPTPERKAGLPIGQSGKVAHGSDLQGLWGVFGISKNKNLTSLATVIIPPVWLWGDPFQMRFVF